jgi:hypothetical protein
MRILHPSKSTTKQKSNRTLTLNIFYCSKRQKDKTQVKQLIFQRDLFHIYLCKKMNNLDIMFSNSDCQH